MVENFYAALFGYDEVRTMFSEDVQEQVDLRINEQRVLHMGKTFALHIFGEMLCYGSRLFSFLGHVMHWIKVLLRKKQAHSILIKNQGCGRRDVLCHFLTTNKSFPPSESHSTQLCFETEETIYMECVREGIYKRYKCLQAFQEENTVTSSLSVVIFLLQWVLLFRCSYWHSDAIFCMVICFINILQMRTC